MPDTLLIKKYANRRLYDTERSRYITLDELATSVRSGRKVKVIEAKGDADLTRAVLVQVILEEQERLDMLPVELLHQVIRAQGTLSENSLTGLLQATWQQWAGVGEAATGGWAQATTAPFTSAMNSWRNAMKPATSRGDRPPSEQHEPQAAPPAAKAADPSTAATEPDLEAEAAKLRKQMEDLLKRLDGS